MAEALYDLIAAGVPHRMSHAQISDADLAKLGLINGVTELRGESDIVNIQQHF